MKNKIEWHQECLKNRINYNEKIWQEITKLREAYDRNEKEIVFYSNQIAKAIEKGKTEFDEDRYMVKRK